MKQNKEIRKFLRKVNSGQCFGLAVWAGKILRREDKEISKEDIERCIRLGLKLNI
jgi:hypothetical protein